MQHVILCNVLFSVTVVSCVLLSFAASSPELCSLQLDGYHSRGSLHKRAVIRGRQRIWSNGIIPYLTVGFSQYQLKVIHYSMDVWMKNTCIKFKPWTGEMDFITIRVVGHFCSAPVGNDGGEQTVNLGLPCFAKPGYVMHELGHVLGLWHEHDRPDRHRFVKILWNNILKEKEYLFLPRKRYEIQSFYSPYDYGSIMHYRLNAFSKNGHATLQAKYKYDGVIGQRELPSDSDYLQVRILYGCQKFVPPCTLPYEGSGGSGKEWEPVFLRGSFNDDNKTNCTDLIYIKSSTVINKTPIVSSSIEITSDDHNTVPPQTNTVEMGSHDTLTFTTSYQLLTSLNELSTHQEMTTIPSFLTNLPLSYTLVTSTPVSYEYLPSTPVSYIPVTPIPLSNIPETSLPLSFRLVTSTPSYKQVISTLISYIPVTHTPLSNIPMTSMPLSFLPVTPTPVSYKQVTLTPVSYIPVTPTPLSNIPVTSMPLQSLLPVTPTPVSYIPVTLTPLSNILETSLPLSFLPVKSTPVSYKQITSTYIPVTPLSNIPLISSFINNQVTSSSVLTIVPSSVIPLKDTISSSDVLLDEYSTISLTPSNVIDMSISSGEPIGLKLGNFNNSVKIHWISCYPSRCKAASCHDDNDGYPQCPPALFSFLKLNKSSSDILVGDIIVLQPHHNKKLIISCGRGVCRGYDFCRIPLSKKCRRHHLKVLVRDKKEGQKLEHDDQVELKFHNLDNDYIKCNKDNKCRRSPLCNNDQCHDQSSSFYVFKLLM